MNDMERYRLLQVSMKKMLVLGRGGEDDHRYGRT